MSSVFKYLKKRFKPFRKCMTISSSNSFELTNSNLKINQLNEQSNSETRSTSKNKLNQKRKFTLKLKRNAKSNLNTILKDGDNKKETQEKRLSLDSKLKEEKKASRTSINSNDIIRIEIDDAENSDMYAGHKMLYNTPNTSNTSDPYAFLSSFTKTEINSCNQTDKLANFIVSSVDGEFLNSTSLGHASSGYVDYASGSNYDADRFSRQSFVNSTPANSNMSTSSMVTYNTKYAKSSLSDDDGLMSVTESRSSLSLASTNNNSTKNKNNNMQQSTPYNETNFARVRSLKGRKSSNKENIVFKKSNTVNFDMLVMREDVEAKAAHKIDTNLNDSINENEVCRKKCRRSNTTYTILGSKSNSKVIEYFSKLEMSKPIKKKANIRKLNNATQTLENTSESNGNKLRNSIESLSKMKDTKLVNKNDTNGNEVEKIQDVLFYDDSSLMNANNSLNTSHQNTNTSYLDSPPSSIKSFMRSPLKNNLKPQNENKYQLQVVKNTLNEPKKINETHLVNCSIEKMRRSVSVPGFNDHSSNFISNVSKISIIKGFDEETAQNINNSNSYQKESTQKTDDTQTLVCIDNKDLSNNNNPSENANENTNNNNNNKNDNNSEFGEFIRGDIQTRSSQNIKLMFKNVVKYQINALSNLEKFYEAHVEKLEHDRSEALLSHQDNQDKINEFFDSQLKMLEDRVQSNLKFICDTKSSKLTSSTSTSSTFNKMDLIKQTDQTPNNLFNQRLSQFMLLKQSQQQKSDARNMPKTLNGLKSNLLNQNSLLPSKLNLNQQVSARLSKNEDNLNDASKLTQNINDFIITNDLMFNDKAFKRNLSLPFHHCKPNSILASVRKESFDNNRLNSVLRTRLSDMANSATRARSNKQATFTSPFESNYQSSYVKTSLNTNQNSITKSGQYQKKMARKYLSSNESIAKLTKSNEALDEIVGKEDKISSKLDMNSYSQIKRQNKSATSLKLELNEMNMTKESEMMTPKNYRFDLAKQDDMSEFRLNFPRNSSLFNNSFLSNQSQYGGDGSSHLIKYLPPRFSDAHIHLRLAQQKMANARNNSNNDFSKYLSENAKLRLEQKRDQLAYSIETEV